ncbi:MAG TPA: FkbM family methyltransferase [Xanthobacteraceae bacterium]|jgi:FkbM family methyltransferase|nr:FkbM family methyltransferase [Xanthobacteraceae bacterium]
MGLIETNMGLPGDFRLRVGADAPVEFFYGTPDTFPGEASALKHGCTLAPSCNVFVDIGAHHGLYLFAICSALDMQAHYIEPNPALFEEVQANVARLGWPKVQGHCMAMAAHDGTVRFTNNLENASMSSIEGFFGNAGQALRTIEAYCSTFDSFAVRHGINNALVKVDVEGAAHLFVEGAAQEFQRIAYLIIEPVGQTGEMLEALPPGVFSYYINGSRLELHSSPVEYQGYELNWLLCWKGPEELRPLLGPAGFQIIG